MKINVFLILISLFVVSCASKTEERELEAKAQESKVSDPKALGGTISDLINSSKTLSDAQKQELVKIIDANKKKADELTEKSFKFRGVLVEELLSENMSKKKIKILKKDIKKIEEEKLKNTFDTVEKISKLVAKDPVKNQISEHLINIERPLR